MLISKNQLKASILKDSFADFVKTMWPVVVPEELIWNWHMDVLCNELQRMAERVFENKPREYDLIINIPPGTSKSSICSVMFPAWVWTRMPSARTICSSYAYSLSLELSRLSRLIIKSEEYTSLFPEIELTRDQDAKGLFINTKGGKRYCASIGGSITGHHGHFLIVDDPMDPNAAISEKELEGVNKWMVDTLPTRKVEKAVTPMILIMQRLHQNDPSGMLLERRREQIENQKKHGTEDSENPIVPIRHICLPGELSKLVRPRSMRKKYINGLLDPVRLSRSVLEGLKPPNLSEFAYSGQIMQSPVPLGGGMFKTDRLTIDIPPPFRKFKQIVRYWDKAGTGGGGAFTVGCLMGIDNQDRYWVLDVIRGQWESSEREKIIKQTSQMDLAMLRRGGYKKLYRIGVEQEPGSGGKESAQNTVKNLKGFSVKVDRPTGDKVLRADPFSTQVNGENVYLKEGDWNHLYTEELRFFPNSTFKDQADASSGGFNMLSNPRKILGALN